MPNPTAWIPRDARVWDVLVREAAALGIDPIIAAEVIFSESHWNPSVKNPHANYAGLNGMGNDELAPFGLNIDTWRSMSADAQLPIIFRFWKARQKVVPIMFQSAAHLYAANFLPARVKSNTSDVDYPLTHKGDPDRFYENNALLDTQGHDFISIRDMGNTLQNKEARNPVDWSFITQQIANAEDRARGLLPATPPGLPSASLAGGLGGGSNAVAPLALAGIVWFLSSRRQRRP